MSLVRAAIYLRISLDREMDGLAIDRQKEACLQIAAERGWAVARTYVDQSRSATDKTKRRHGYERMVADYKTGEFSVIICWDLDRLTRQPRQLEDWIDASETRGLRILTANGEADLATDGGRMYARIKAAVARVERSGAGRGGLLPSFTVPAMDRRRAACDCSATPRPATSSSTRPRRCASSSGCARSTTARRSRR